MYELTVGESISVLFRIDETELVRNGRAGLMTAGTATMRLSSLSEEEIKVAYRAPAIAGLPMQTDEDFVERLAKVGGYCVNHVNTYSRPKIGVQYVIVEAYGQSLPVYIDGPASQ